MNSKILNSIELNKIQCKYFIELPQKKKKRSRRMYYDVNIQDLNLRGVMM
jgi:hypothetical protein